MSPAIRMPLVTVRLYILSLTTYTFLPLQRNSHKSQGQEFSFLNMTFFFFGGKNQTFENKLKKSALRQSGYFPSIILFQPIYSGTKMIIQEAPHVFIAGKRGKCQSQEIQYRILNGTVWPFL